MSMNRHLHKVFEAPGIGRAMGLVMGRALAWSLWDERDRAEVRVSASRGRHLNQIGGKPD